MTWALRAYDLPLAVPYRWSQGIQESRQGVIVKHGQDPAGWGEVAPPPHDVPSDLLAQTQSWTDRWQKAPPRIRCGLSTAIFDHQARQDGITLGWWLHENHDAPKPRSDVAVNALLTADAQGIEAEARAAWKAGHRTFKIKVGGSQDKQRVSTVRQILPRAIIRLDANAAWPLARARQALRTLEPYNIEYIEQPISPDDEAGLLDLTKESVIPLALDESATDAETIRRLIEAGIGDAVILKPQRVGGLDRAVEVMALCHDSGIPVTVTNSLETSVGLHAALHLAAVGPDVACGLGTARYFAKNVAEPPVIKEGIMTITGPGSGVVM